MLTVAPPILGSVIACFWRSCANPEDKARPDVRLFFLCGIQYKGDSLGS